MQSVRINLRFFAGLLLRILPSPFLFGPPAFSRQRPDFPEAHMIVG
jgi:hypothetical protein